MDAAGENAIVVVPGANAAVSAADLAPLERLGPDDVVLAQMEVPAAVTAAGRAARRRARRPGRAQPRAVRRAAAGRGRRLRHPVVVNEHEALQLADSGLVPATMVVTFGAAGAAWDGQRSTGPQVPAADVVDTDRRR